LRDSDPHRPESRTVAINESTLNFSTCDAVNLSKFKIKDRVSHESRNIPVKRLSRFLKVKTEKRYQKFNQSQNDIK
jgi:uncharacterized membrane-anchored protein